MSNHITIELPVDRANVRVASTGDKGRGVVARRPFAPGERVFTVTGARTIQRTRYTLQVSATEHIEPDGAGKYLNHSCHPNAGVRTRADGRPDIVAIKPIAAGEEVTADYAMFEYEVGPSGEGACLCATAACRGRITGYRDTDSAWRLQYGLWVAAYLHEQEGRAAA